MKEKIAEIIRSICPHINPETDMGLISNMLIDSFEMIQIIGAIMDEFSIEIDIDDMEPEVMDTLDGICKMVERQSK